MERAKNRATFIADNVCANMKIEGFHVSDATRSDCIAVASGKKSADEIIKARLVQYGMGRK